MRTPPYSPENPPPLRRPGESVEDYRVRCGWDAPKLAEHTYGHDCGVCEGYCLAHSPNPTAGTWVARSWIQPPACGATTVLVEDPVLRAAGGVRVIADCESEADARLIAASKEMFGAIEAMLAWDEAEKNAKPYVDDNGVDFHRRLALCRTAFDLARAARAKATGGAS